VCSGLVWELKPAIKVNKLRLRGERAARDVVNIEGWVGSEIWRQMVHEAMVGLATIFRYKDRDGFWNKRIHQLAN